MTVPVGGFLKSVVSGTFLTQNWQNVFWWRMSASETADNVSTLINAWLHDSMYAGISTELSSVWAIDTFETFYWANPPMDYNSIASAIAGGNFADQPMPSAICVTFSNRPGYPGQRYSYKRINGLPEGRVNGNAIAPVAAFDTFAARLSDVVTTSFATAVPVQVHSASIPPVGIGAEPSFNRFLTDDWVYKIGTQNSRKPGYGS
jgi:hypothetical protein